MLLGDQILKVQFQNTWYVLSEEQVNYWFNFISILVVVNFVGTEVKPVSLHIKN